MGAGIGPSTRPPSTHISSVAFTGWLPPSAFGGPGSAGGPLAGHGPRLTLLPSGVDMYRILRPLRLAPVGDRCINSADASGLMTAAVLPTLTCWSEYIPGTGLAGSIHGSPRRHLLMGLCLVA